MVLTATTILLFVALGIAAIIGGFYMDKPEVYVFGCAVLLILGIMTAEQGFPEKIGENVTEVTDGNETTTTTINVYGENKTLRTNAISALLMLLGVGAALTFWVARRKEKKEREQDVDLIP